MHLLSKTLYVLAIILMYSAPCGKVMMDCCVSVLGYVSPYVFLLSFYNVETKKNTKVKCNICPNTAFQYSRCVSNCQQGIHRRRNLINKGLATFHKIFSTSISLKPPKRPKSTLKESWWIQSLFIHLFFIKWQPF